MMRLVGTLATAALVVWGANRILESPAGEAWRAPVEAARAQVAGAVRHLTETPADPAPLPRTSKPLPQQSETAALPDESATPAPAMPPPAARSMPAPRSPALPAPLTRADTAAIRRRLDRVMLLASGRRP